MCLCTSTSRCAEVGFVSSSLIRKDCLLANPPLGEVPLPWAMGWRCRHRGRSLPSLGLGSWRSALPAFVQKGALRTLLSQEGLASPWGVTPQSTPVKLLTQHLSHPAKAGARGPASARSPWPPSTSLNQMGIFEAVPYLTSQQPLCTCAPAPRCFRTPSLPPYSTTPDSSGFSPLFWSLLLTPVQRHFS